MKTLFTTGHGHPRAPDSRFRACGGIGESKSGRAASASCVLRDALFDLSGSMWRKIGRTCFGRCGCQAGSPQPQANFACACALKKIRVTSIMLRSDAPVRHKARSSDQTERTQRYRVVAPLVCWISVICASRHTQAPPEGWLGGLALPARTEAADRLIDRLAVAAELCLPDVLVRHTPVPRVLLAR